MSEPKVQNGNGWTVIRTVAGILAAITGTIFTSSMVAIQFIGAQYAPEKRAMEVRLEEGQKAAEDIAKIRREHREDLLMRQQELHDYQIRDRERIDDEIKAINQRSAERFNKITSLDTDMMTAKGDIEVVRLLAENNQRRIGKLDEAVARIGQLLNEREVQNAWVRTDLNVLRGTQHAWNSLLWRKVYGEEFPALEPAMVGPEQAERARVNGGQ